MYGTTLMTAALLPFQKARMPSSPDQSGEEMVTHVLKIEGMACSLYTGKQTQM
jgi:hypothetical protein